MFLELLFKTNSNPKSNLVLKDHSKSHILPVSAKSAIPRSVSVSSFCVSSTLPNSSDTMVQKPSFDSYLFMSSSFTYSASQRSLRKKRSVFRVILVRIFLAFGLNAEKCGKNTHQNNSKYGHFVRSGSFCHSKFSSPKIPTTYNSLRANPTKWSNKLKQFVGKLPTNCLMCLTIL